MLKTYSTSPDNGATWAAKRHAPATYANNTSPPSDADLATIGQYPEVYPDPVTCSAPCCSPSTDPTLVDGQAVYSAVNLSDEDCAAVQRTQYQQQIEGQVGSATVAQVLEDPAIEADIVRQQAAATDKLAELGATADVDLPAFEVTLDVAQPQADFGYAQLTLVIAEVEPWVGAPTKTEGWVAELHIQEDYAADGADARISITDSPAGPRPNLSFTVDPDDPKLWTAQVEDGYAWLPEDTGPVSATLIWGSGSVTIGRILTSPALHVRDSMNTRYGLPEGAGRARAL